MKTRVVLLFSLTAVLFSLAAIAQVNDTYVIPAAANASGGGGTRWATEFYLFNPQSYPLKVTLVYLPTGVAVGDTATFTVDANMTAYSDNILDDVFDVSGTGALLVATFPEDNPSVPNRVIDRSFIVRSNTFNNSLFGTFGQPIPGIWTGLMDFDFDGISGVAQGIRNRGEVGRSGFRTNIGAVNLGRTSVRVLVNVYNTSGQIVRKDIPFTVPPEGHVQDLLPVEIDRGSLEFFVDDFTQKAVVFPYASVVDNRTGDPVYISPVLLASPGAIYKNAAAATTEAGRKIDSSYVREIARKARQRGMVTLKTQ